MRPSANILPPRMPESDKLLIEKWNQREADEREEMLAERKAEERARALLRRREAQRPNSASAATSDEVTFEPPARASLRHPIAASLASRTLTDEKLLGGACLERGGLHRGRVHEPSPFASHNRFNTINFDYVHSWLTIKNR